MAKNKYYAVKKGLTPGIYNSWDECKEMVSGYPGAIYKSFSSMEEAENYINDCVSKPNNSNSQDKIEMPDGVVAYVDGSFDAKTNTYSCGVVILDNGKEKHFTRCGYNEDLAAMRNIAGELLGSMVAMKYAKDNHLEAITIYHDYQGISSWCLGDWKTKKEGTAEYKKYYEKISKSVKISFEKVKGHTGVYYNELADSLAKKELGIKITKNMENHINEIKNQETK